jgi:hypothetical protein
MRAAVHVSPSPNLAHPSDPGIAVNLPPGSDALGLLIVGPTGTARHVFAIFGPRGGLSLTPGFRVSFSPAHRSAGSPVEATFLPAPLPDAALAPLPLPAAAVVASLRPTPTFSALFVLANAYGGHDPWVLPPLDSVLGAVASVLCRVADGWLLLPARAADPNAGWEQLDLDAAVLLPDAPEIPQMLAQWNAAAVALRRTLLAACDDARAVPSVAASV